MAMLHSFWQAALVVLLYNLVCRWAKNNPTPIASRNFLYIALLMQTVLLLATFTFYYVDARNNGLIPGFAFEINTAAFGTQLQMLTPWIFSAYLAVVAAKFITAAGGWISFRKQYMAGLQKPQADLKIFTTLKARHLGINRRVTLWLSHSVQTPITFGFLKPVILLPVALVNNISTRQAEALILHELTHIRTNDYLLNWFLIGAETLFFFNPFVTRLCKQIRLEREKHCDLNVINFAYSPVMYAETLLHAERIKQLVPNFQLAAVGHKEQLLHRIKYFTGEDIKNGKQSTETKLLAPLVGLIILALLSIGMLFQTGKSQFPAGAFVEAQAMPFNNYIVADAAFNTTIKTIPVLPTEQALPDNSVTGKDPKLKSGVKDQAMTSTRKTTPEVELVPSAVQPPTENYIIPVTTKENDAARQIIIKEEEGGSSTVKVYNLHFENGSWILQPEWIITAKEVQADSLNKIKTDSLKIKFKQLYPHQQ